MNNRKAHIITYGCQMNERDSEVMATLLKRDGWQLTDRPETADVVIVNTCAVREHAVVRALGRANNLKRLKYENPDSILAICGCIAQTETDRILSEVDHIDLILGTREMMNLPEHLNAVMDSEEVIVSVNSNQMEPVSPMIGERADDITSFVFIMRGCDNRCSYCIVPQARGSEVYRDYEDILREVQLLDEAGYKEVTLIGQNVNAWSFDGISFADLLSRIDRMTDIPHIRFVTSHPRNLTEDIISAMSESPSICKSLHLPLQSGSDKILKLMKRGYTMGDYSDLISKMRDAMPDIAITTDLIVGFPGENESDFQDTLTAVEEISFDGAFTFKYSPRVNTPARDLPGQVPEEIRGERLRKLIERVHQVGRMKNEKRLGKRYEVLIEKGAKRGGMMGRASSNHPVVIEEDLSPGDMVTVEIVEVSQWTLKGELVE